MNNQSEGMTNGRRFVFARYFMRCALFYYAQGPRGSGKSEWWHSVSRNYVVSASSRWNDWSVGFGGLRFPRLGEENHICRRPPPFARGGDPPLTPFRDANFVRIAPSPLRVTNSTALFLHFHPRMRTRLQAGYLDTRRVCSSSR